MQSEEECERKEQSKIGRPAKTEVEQSFKEVYLESKVKLELECELLVTVYDVFLLGESAAQVPPSMLFELFEAHNCTTLYLLLCELNEAYFMDSALLPHDPSRYTSVIDVAYMLRRASHSFRIKGTELFLVILFFLFNEKLVNYVFFYHFAASIHLYRRAIIQGPRPAMSNVDILIVAFALEITAKEQIMIVESALEDDGDETADKIIEEDQS